MITSPRLRNFSFRLALAAVSLSCMAASPANAASIFHYAFSSDSYYTYQGSPVNTPVSGSFDFDSATGVLSNVNYTSVSGSFTTGAEYNPGVDTEIYFGDRSGNYDVYQLASSLSAGGTVKIASGTHQFIGINAGGSLTTNSTAAVPEPASWAMMVGGFGLLGAAMRRRRAGDALFAA